MLSHRFITIFVLSFTMTGPAAAQEGSVSKPRTAAGAVKFIQDVLTRGSTEAKPWPGSMDLSKVAKAEIKDNCLITLSLVDKSSIRIDLARSIGIRTLLSANAPQSLVEIRGGVQPYDGIDLYIGDNTVIRRTGDAMTFLRNACDRSSESGF